MKYILNIINRACLKELLKDDIFSRVSLTMKIVASMLILTPISYIVSIILPEPIDLVARIIFYGALVISFLAIVFEVKLYNYSSSLEKALENNFYYFLRYCGFNESNIGDMFLIHQVEKAYFKDYLKCILDSNIPLYSKEDILHFDYRRASTFNPNFKILEEGLKRVREAFNMKMNSGRTYNSRTGKYEERTRKQEFSFNSDYENALKCFNLSKNFTKDDLKKAYRKKIKEVHPDSGGSKEMFLKVQKYFEILEK